MARPKLEKGMIQIAPKYAIKASAKNYVLYEWGLRKKYYGNGVTSERYDWKKVGTTATLKDTIKCLMEHSIRSSELTTLSRIEKKIDSFCKKINPEEYYRRLLLENASRILQITRLERERDKLKLQIAKLEEEKQQWQKM